MTPALIVGPGSRVITATTWTYYIYSPIYLGCQELMKVFFTRAQDPWSGDQLWSIY